MSVYEELNKIMSDLRASIVEAKNSAIRNGGGLIFAIAKAPKEFTMIMLALAWGGMFLAILWALGRWAYYLLLR